MCLSISYLIHQLRVALGDTVDGARPLHTQLRGGIPGRGCTGGLTKHADHVRCYVNVKILWRHTIDRQRGCA